MRKLTIAAVAALAFTAPAFAAMDIKDYPRTAAEFEYCVKARFDHNIQLPEGCKTLGERLWERLAADLKKL